MGSALCVVLFTVIVVSSLIGNIAIDVVAFGLLCFVYLSTKKGFTDVRRIDADTFSLIRNIRLNYRRGASAKVVLLKSIGTSFVFGKDLSLAVNTYFRSGDANFSFAGLKKYKSAIFEESISMIKDYAERGADIGKRLEDMAAFSESLEKQQLRSHGSFTNAFSVVRMGSVLFFPMFAGISYRIIAFSASMGLSGSIASQSIIPIILFYIVVSNVIGSVSFYSGAAINVVASNASLCAGGALLVFSATSLAALFMLR